MSSTMNSPAHVHAGADEASAETRALARFDSVRTWPRPWQLIVALIILLAHVPLAHDYYGPVTVLCAGAEGALLVLILTRYANLRPPRLPWLEFVFVVHYAAFGLAVTVEPLQLGLGNRTPSREAFDLAAVLALAGGMSLIAGFMAGTAAFRRARLDGLLPTLTPEILAKGARLHFPAAVAFVLVTAFYPAARLRLGGALTLLEGTFSLPALVAVATVAYLSEPGAFLRARLLLAIGTVGVSVAISSMLGNAILPLTGVAMLWWRARGRIPLLPVFAAIALLIVLQPVKGYYRDLRWSHDTRVGVIDAWQEAFSKTFDGITGGGAQQGSEQTRKRLGELSTTAYVLEVVPAAVPHTGGESYELVAVGAIPRLFWPNKPDMTKAGLDKFTVALGLLTWEGAQTTTTGLTLVSHGYLEHGTAGSIAWMFFLGIVLAGLAKYFGPTLAGSLAGTALLVGWVTATAGGFVSCFGTLWQNVFAATILSWLLWLLGGGASRSRRVS